MKKEYNYKDSLNMVTAVSTSYVPREEIIKYFEENFDKEKVFSPEEIKSIVKELVSNRKRISENFNVIWTRKKAQKDMKEANKSNKGNER